MIDHLLRHTADIHRPTQTRGSTFKEPVVTYSSTPTTSGQAVEIQRTRQDVSDLGPGEYAVGDWKGFAAADLDVQERDVLNVTAGDNASIKLEVVGVYTPRGHHTELRLQEWPGVFAT